MWCVLMLALLSAGCAGTSPELAASLDAVPERDAVACDSADCALQWQRAQLWIARHSKWKIQTATDVLIQTYGAVDQSPYHSFTVTREALGSGRYAISVDARCGNIFGCAIRTDRVKRAFYHYITTGEDLLIRER